MKSDDDAPRVNRRFFLQQGLSAAVALSAAACASSRATMAPARTTTRGAGPEKVIVIGAGLAGMSAAYELTAAGYDVTVLEAQNRAGGRVQTIRGQLEDDQFVNLGATGVHDNHDLTMGYVKRFGVEFDTPRVGRPGAAGICYMRGQRILEPRGKVVEWPVDLRADERGKTFQELWDRYFGHFVNGVRHDEVANPPAARLAALDSMSFADFMRQQGASEAAIAVLRVSGVEHAGGGVDKVSALYGIRDLAHRVGMTRRATVRGGTDHLPAAFAASLGTRIRYRAPVTAIMQDDASVQVTWLDRGVPTTWRADRVVCAIPFPLLQRIDVRPAFSDGKRRAIVGLRQSTVVRAFIQCRTAFWRDQGLTGSARTDLPIMNLFPHEANQPGTHQILECYITKEHGKHLGTLSEEERAALILENVRRVHPAIDQHAGRVLTKVWEHDEWARGAYAWAAPGEMAAFGPHLASIEGRVHFAGDHTSAWPGWMQGAFESGRRAAQEITSSRKYAAR